MGVQKIQRHRDGAGNVTRTKVMWDAERAFDVEVENGWKPSSYFALM